MMQRLLDVKMQHPCSYSLQGDEFLLSLSGYRFTHPGSQRRLPPIAANRSPGKYGLDSGAGSLHVSVY